MVLLTALVVVGVILIYRILFIRTVNYNIAGIDIPAKYNILTGKAVPITNYKGKIIKKTITDKKSDRLGLDSGDVTAAQFRWALFEEWVGSRKEYKGWESDPEIFKKANEEFKEKVKANVRVLK
jgi:hypothetical protein